MQQKILSNGLNRTLVNEQEMIKKGNTIVYRGKNEQIGFYWLCDIIDTDYLFFDWYGNPKKPLDSDYWRIHQDWFQQKIEDGTIEVYDSLPLDKYGDIFEKQATKRNR